MKSKFLGKALAYFSVTYFFMCSSAFATADETRVVALVLDFNDATISDDHPVGAVAETLQLVRDYFAQRTYGGVTLNTDFNDDGAVDIVGPIATGLDAFARCNDSYTSWANKADASARASGVPIDSYARRIYIVPDYRKINCPWAGRSSPNCTNNCQTWIAAAGYPAVWVHELASTFGLGHAGTDPDDNGTANTVFGDWSDPMSNRHQLGTMFNGANMFSSGWLQAAHPAAVFTLAPVRTRILDLTALAKVPGQNDLQVVQIEAGAKSYILSYRQAEDRDVNLPAAYTTGLSLHTITAGVPGSLWIRTLSDGDVWSNSEFSITQESTDRISQRVRVRVEFPGANVPPMVSLGNPQVIELPTAPISLPAIATDTDGTIVSYGWQQNSGPAVGWTEASDHRSIMIPFTTPGLYQFSVTVTDNDGATGSAQVQLQVLPPNLLPTASAGADFSIPVSSTYFQLRGLGKDTDGVITKIWWEKLSGPATLTVGASAAPARSWGKAQGERRPELTQMVNEDDERRGNEATGLRVSGTRALDQKYAYLYVYDLKVGVYTFRLHVQDNRQGSVYDDITVTVTDDYKDPVVSAGPDVTVTLPITSATLRGSVLDTSSRVKKFEWVFISGPSIPGMEETQNPGVKFLTYLIAYKLIAGSYTFRLNVYTESAVFRDDVVLTVVN